MMENKESPILGVVGAGAMGAGIAQVAASSGITVHLYDLRDGAARTACESIAARLHTRVQQGKLDQTEADAVMRRLQAASTLDALKNCNVVIEAIVEDLDAKAALFTQLEGVVGDDTILASNTSSLPIGALASRCQRPQRVAGLHFFNPVPLMRLVEVIAGPETDAKVIDHSLALTRKLGKTPVVVRDTPGFLVNLGGRAYPTEALAIVHEGVAEPSQIDAVLRDCHGFRMGPFELMDLTGMDVNYPVTRFVHEAYAYDPRLRTTPQHRYMVDTGRLGRKSGKGFFEYGNAVDMSEPVATTTTDPLPSVYVHGDAPELRELLTACGAEVQSADDGQCAILIAPLGDDCSAYAARESLDHRRTVAIDTLGDISERVTLMCAPGVNVAIRQSIVDLFACQRKVTVIGDSPGFIGQRVLAMVANLGCEMAQTGVASVEDIDTAMRLGLNYPLGPLELTDALGVRKVYHILQRLQSLTGDDRYRPSQWLRRRAELDVPARLA